MADGGASASIVWAAAAMRVPCASETGLGLRVYNHVSGHLQALTTEVLIVAHYVPAEKRHVGRSFTNVLVKNFRDDVTDEQLAAAFASCGKITSAVVSRDANGKSKRHGFCNFETAESAVKCIEQFNDTETIAVAGEKISVVQHLKKSDYLRVRQMSTKGGADKAPF